MLRTFFRVVFLLMGVTAVVLTWVSWSTIAVTFMLAHIFGFPRKSLAMLILSGILNVIAFVTLISSLSANFLAFVITSVAFILYLQCVDGIVAEVARAD